MKRSRLTGFVVATLVSAAALTAVVHSQEPERREGRTGGGPGRPVGPGGPGMRMMPVMQALDTDGDGELSAKEIENATAALKTLDKDKNGKLTQDELRPDFGGPPEGAGRSSSELVDRLMASDRNGDGKLSAEELPARMKPLMARADANKDGFLDRAELTQLARQQQPRMFPGRPEDRPTLPRPTVSAPET